MHGSDKRACGLSCLSQPIRCRRERALEQTVVTFDNRVIRPAAAFESAMQLENFVLQMSESGRNANKKLLQVNEVDLRVTGTIPPALSTI